MSKPKQEFTSKEISLPASISTIAALSGHNRATVVKRLDESGILPVLETEKKKLYRLHEAIQALIRFESGQSSADRRNLAQARKAEVETLILEEKYAFDGEEIHGFVREIFGAFNQLVQNSPASDEDKEQFVKSGEGVLIRIQERVEA